MEQHLQINTGQLFKSYCFMLFSFIASRLLSQTDLIMLAPLGQEAVAAFAAPSRLMFIDAIVAFALGPVISVVVSREKTENRAAVIASSFGLTLVISLILVFLGLLIYPQIAAFLLPDQEVSHFARQGIFGMTVSIPIRMLVFIATMCLFACNQGGRVVYIYAVTILANGILNWVFIYHFSWGFPGAYISTVVVSTLELIWLLWLTYKTINAFPIKPFRLAWLRTLLSQVGYEWLRLLFLYAEGMVIIAILASRKEWQSAFSTFSIITYVGT
ncbi:MAG: MATE family efflux transporter [Enterobacteriaceae bacterium]